MEEKSESEQVKKRVKMRVRGGKERKERRSELGHAREREWGNSFHFPFSSSSSPDFNRYPLKLIPSLQRNRRKMEESCALLTQRAAMKLAGGSGKQHQLVSNGTLFGRQI